MGLIHEGKSEIFSKFNVWNPKVEKEQDRSVKCLRSDNDDKLTSRKSQHFCKKCGIKRYFSIRGTPQQNGVAEGINRILMEKARCMKLQARPILTKA